MPITDQEAVDYGFLVAFAEGMYVQGSTTPQNEPRIAAAGWDVVGHLLAFELDPARRVVAAPGRLEFAAARQAGFLWISRAQSGRPGPLRRRRARDERLRRMGHRRGFRSAPDPVGAGGASGAGLLEHLRQHDAGRPHRPPDRDQGGRRHSDRRRRRRNGDDLRAQSRFRARHVSQLRHGEAAREPGERLPHRVSAHRRSGMGGRLLRRGRRLSAHQLRPRRRALRAVRRAAGAASIRRFPAPRSCSRRRRRRRCGSTSAATTMSSAIAR